MEILSFSLKKRTPDERDQVTIFSKILKTKEPAFLKARMSGKFHFTLIVESSTPSPLRLPEYSGRSPTPY